jgi:hypothetical protein
MIRRKETFAWLPVVVLVGVGLSGCSIDPGLEEWDPVARKSEPAEIEGRSACLDRSQLRRAFFGDLHVHTGVSMDARIQGTTTTPADAYRFARGEEIGLSPFDAEGRPQRLARIDRPLDFAAVTDHAEWMAENALCTEEDSPVYETHSCRIFRSETRSFMASLLGLKGFRAKVLGVVSLDGRNREVCGEDLSLCRARLGRVWSDMQRVAEEFYDRSEACRFTTFHAWEYSRSTGSSKIHRNVILRNEIGPELPFSWIDTPDEESLRAKLRDLCLESGSGCDAIAIPHNPNLSNGHQFSIPYRERPIEEQRRAASLRARLEPIVEMMQIKGESECRNGLYGVVGEEDELCGFEKIREAWGWDGDCEEGVGAGAQKGKGCVSRVDYVRYALIEGLREASRIGVNPHQFGFIGSTDTHRSTPGAVDEREFVGKFPIEPEEMLEIGDQLRANIYRNPGGLAGLYAEENSRDALFDAMKRREAFATSGPRIEPRFFGGWEYPDDLCGAPDLLEHGYARGVPMGGDLPERSTANASPVFILHATQDPGSADQRGTALQRLQIVKGWVGDDGLFHQRVIDVAGDAENGARVDLQTCEPQGQGASELCSVWRDPDFDAGRPSVYYARVIENPSCRWSTRQCLALPPEERPDGCDDPRVPKTIQERAWTSPIWFTPSGDASQWASSSRSAMR